MNKAPHTTNAFVALTLFAMGNAMPLHCAETTLERMPAALETQYALSAIPPRLRDKAAVYLLDPQKGYSLSRAGTSGVACAVQRTQCEYARQRGAVYPASSQLMW